MTTYNKDNKGIDIMAGCRVPEGGFKILETDECFPVAGLICENIKEKNTIWELH